MKRWHQAPGFWLFAAALLIRLVGLGAQSYWLDEATEINRALVSWQEIVLLPEGPDPPLLRLLLAPLARLSRSEYLLRLPSALFGAASVTLLYRWASLLFRRRLAVVAAALLAIAPVAVLYSQEVSQYSLAVFLTLALLFTFERAAQRGRPVDWLLLFVATVAALYSYYGLFWIVPLLDVRLLLALWRKRGEEGSRKRAGAFLLVHLGLLLAFVVLYFFYIRAGIAYQEARVVNPFFRQMGVLDAVRTFALALYPSILRFLTIGFNEEAPAVIPLFFGSLALLGAVALWHRPQGRGPVALAGAILVTFFVASGLGYYRFGLRYGLPLLPFLALFLGAGLCALARWRRAAGVMAALLATGLFVAFLPNLSLLPEPWRQEYGEALRPVLDHVATRAAPEEPVYVYYGAVPAFRVYDPAWENPTVLGRWFRHLPAAEQGADVVRAVDCAPRFWLVLSHIHLEEDEVLIGALANTAPSYELVAAHDETNARALLFRRLDRQTGAPSLCQELP